jgi:GTP cyclohydrolase I
MVQFETILSDGGSSAGSGDSRPNGTDIKKERRKKRKLITDDSQDAGVNGSSFTRHGRRYSISKPARDLRDEPHGKPKKKKKANQESATSTRSPSPVIDFDGLSRPSRGTRERLEESEEQAAARLDKMRGAVRTILECVGEDPDREGLLATPERYAKAMLFFTKGYQQNVRDIVNGAIFHEGHNEMVIVKDIDIFSLCEHHLVPFNGKVRMPA